MAEPRGRRRLHGLLALAWAAAVWTSAPAAAQPTGEWSAGAPLPAPRRLLAATSEDGRLYALGGCGSPCFSPPQHVDVDEETRVEVYDPDTDSWQSRRPMPYVFFDGAAAAPGDGFVYTVGGAFSAAVVERYDLAADTWSRRARLPTPRHGLAAATIGGLIYVVGGSDGRRASGALEIYDPAADAWTRGPPMPTPRAQLAAAVVGGRLFAIGGSPDCCGGGASAAVEVYDPSAGVWSAATPLPSPRQVGAAAAVDGRLFVFGGFVPGAGVLAETLEYVPELDGEPDRWIRLADLPTPRDQAAVAVLGGRAVLVGGSVDCHCRALDTVESFRPPPTPPRPPPEPLTADLSCILAAPVMAAAGDRASFTLTARNNGPDAASGSRVVLRLPPQLGDLTWTCAASPGATCPATGAGGLAVRVDIPAGGSLRFELAATVAASATCPLPTSLDVSARASTPAGVRDPRRGNNACAVAVAYDPVADLTLEQETATEVPLAGCPAVFLLTASNLGPDAACGASLTSMLPPGLLEPEWNCLDAPGLCTPPAGGEDAGIVDLPAGGVATLTLTVLVAADAPCRLVHPAAIAPPAGVVDPVLDNNTAAAALDLALCPPPTVTKTVSPTLAAEGDVVEYVVTLVNPSAVPLPDGPGDEWVDTLPPEVSPFEISADAGVAELDGQTARWNGALPAGGSVESGSVEIRLLAVVEPGNAGLVVCNQGALFAGVEPGCMVDLPPIESDDPSLPGPADPTCFEIEPEDDDEPVGPFPIPALGGVGRPLVVVLIAVVGVIVLRRWGRRGLRQA